MLLQRFDTDSLELFINLENGACYASQRGLARMVGVDATSLRRWKGGAQITTLEAEIDTAGGLQGVSLFDENSIYEAFLKYKPELLVQCAKAGLRVFLHGLAGFQVRSTAVVQEAPKNDAQLILEMSQSISRANKTYLEIQEGLALYDPRLAQIAIDRLFQAVQGNVLAPSATPSLCGCVEIASNLGFKVGKEESSLGKAVAKAWRNAYNSEPETVKRECGGAFRTLKVYPSDDPIVVATIKQFYQSRKIEN